MKSHTEKIPREEFPESGHRRPLPTFSIASAVAFLGADAINVAMRSIDPLRHHLTDDEGRELLRSGLRVLAGSGLLLLALGVVGTVLAFRRPEGLWRALPALLGCVGLYLYFIISM